uniref:DUF6598 domain-containing protein n=1 Tax=Setaria italica TaxID=4555 RepID=K4AKX2_SETIT
MEKCEVERKNLATRFSIVDLLYAIVIGAVEATIGIRVLQGKFDGTISAHTTSIMLYDSKVAGTRTADVGVIQLTRRVVSIYVKDMLIIEAKTGDGKSVRRVDFAPRGNNGR